LKHAYFQCTIYVARKSMSSSPALRLQPCRPAIPFDRLPDKPQSLICTFASTLSCPAHLLLALVCKGWGAEAARRFREDGASIEIVLQSSTGDPLNALEKEVERLHGLAEWLRQYGHLLNGLTISFMEPVVVDAEHPFMQETAQVIPSILDSLAAAGKRPGGLRLQQLGLPVFGSTSIFTICRALSACHQLRRLYLGDSNSGQATRSYGAVLGMLPAALRQLTQLTGLVLEGALFQYSGMGAAADLSSIVEALPESLVSLDVSAYDEERGALTAHLHTSSLQHLTALQELELPDHTRVSTSTGSSSGRGNSSDSSSSSSSSSGIAGAASSGSGGAGSSRSRDHNPLAQLTAVTYLVCGTALQRYGAPLLALPNLVELRATDAEPALLETLVGRTALRCLGCTLSPLRHVSQAAALQQLTQLTELAALLGGVDQNLVLDLGQGVVAPMDPALLLMMSEGRLAAAVSAMTGLRKLRLEPLLWEKVDLGVLTALTSIGLDFRDTEEWQVDLPGVLEVLARLAPLRGQLQEVMVLGLIQDQEEACCTVLSAVVGDVEVEFL
jgi:hypothetical protein